MIGAAYAGGLLVFALHLGLSCFSRAVLPGLAATALLAVVVLVCTGSGRVALRLFGDWELSPSEKTLIGCTLGLGILSTGMFALGCVGALRPWGALGLLSVLWIVGWTEMGEALASLSADRNLLRDRPLAALAVAVPVALAFWACWVPPHQYDSLVYHLPLAAAYLRTGRIAPVEHLLFSHFPQNGEMLFALALALGSDLLAQMFAWLGLALSLWWVFEIGKREMPTAAALLACGLLATHTAVLLLATAAYVETFVMLWVTAAVLCFCRWRETQTPGWLALSAVFAGLGLGTKYYAGICPAALLFLLLWRRPSPRDLALFCGLAAAAGVPWLAKNLVFVGNPVFPFLYDRLPHHGVAWAGENARRYFEFLTEYGHRPGHFLMDLAQFPYLAAMGSMRFGGGMDVLGDLGWGPSLALLPLSVLAARGNRAWRWVLGYCALHWAVWFSTGVVLRFLTVIAPLLCLPAAAGLHRLWGDLGRRGRGALGAAAGVFVAVNLGLFLYVHAVFGSQEVLLGLEDRDSFLSRKLDYFPCARWAADHLGKNDRILLVGEQRGYYVRQDHVTTTPMAPNPFVEWANGARSPRDLAVRLHSDGGFTHLLFVPREARRLGPYGVFAFDEKGLANWTGLEAGPLRRAFAAPSGSCALFEITPG